MFSPHVNPNAPKKINSQCTPSPCLCPPQHKPVYTVGKRPREHNILADEARLAELGVEVHRTRRGGDVTYHGPGQFTLYPIVGLRQLGVGARTYVEGKRGKSIAGVCS